MLPRSTADCREPYEVSPMKHKTIGIAMAAAAVLASTSLARTDEATLRLRTAPGRAGMDAVAILQGPAGAPFALFAEVEGVPGRRFCLTIDRQAPAYLPRIFGAGGYAILDRPEALPMVLIDWLKRLITR